MNLAHYFTSARLELGRNFASFPIYVVPIGPGEEDTERYYISPHKVWEVPADSKPYVLEYYGQGLNHLAEALVEKERQIVQLGARLIGVRDIGTKYEAPSIFELLYRSELSVLSAITEVLADGLKQAIVMALQCDTVSAYQINNNKVEVVVEISQEFKKVSDVAKQLKTLAGMTDEGKLPLKTLFKLLQDAEFVGSEITFEQYMDLLEEDKVKREKEKLKEKEAEMRLQQKFAPKDVNKPAPLKSSFPPKKSLVEKKK
jgi:hypothetical protein